MFNSQCLLPVAQIFEPTMFSWYTYFCQFEWHVCELARAKGTLTIINNLQQKQHEASFWSLHSSQSVTHWVSSLMLLVIQFCNCFLHISIFMEQLGAYKINMLCECYKHGHIVPELKKKHGLCLRWVEQGFTVLLGSKPWDPVGKEIREWFLVLNVWWHIILNDLRPLFSIGHLCSYKTCHYRFCLATESLHFGSTCLW